MLRTLCSRNESSVWQVRIERFPKRMLCPKLCLRHRERCYIPLLEISSEEICFVAPLCHNNTTHTRITTTIMLAPQDGCRAVGIPPSIICAARLPASTQTAYPVSIQPKTRSLLGYFLLRSHHLCFLRRWNLVALFLLSELPCILSLIWANSDICILLSSYMLPGTGLHPVVNPHQSYPNQPPLLPQLVYSS